MRILATIVPDLSFCIPLSNQGSVILFLCDLPCFDCTFHTAIPSEKDTLAVYTEISKPFMARLIPADAFTPARIVFRWTLHFDDLKIGVIL